MSTSHRQSRHTVRHTGTALVNIVLLVVTLAGVAYIAPSLFGYERYVITGGSMSGTIEKGSVVFEQRVPVDELEVGDVITYLPPASSGVTTLVTHRIDTISATDGGLRLRTQGDANPDPDPWTFSLVEADQPVVQHTVPLVGHAMIALADRDVRMIAIGAPAALVAVGALVELCGAMRPRRLADVRS